MMISPKHSLFILISFYSFAAAGPRQNASGLARTQLYPSGFIRSWSDEAGVPEKVNPEHAVAHFLESNFQADLEWKKIHSIVDKTHVYYIYVPYYRGVRVADSFVKVAFNVKGWVEYVNSTLENPIQLPSLQKEIPTKAEETVRSKLIREYGKFGGAIFSEPVIWIDPRSKTVTTAFDVKAQSLDQHISRWFIVDKLGNILREKQTRFKLDTEVYKINPNRRGLETVTLSDLASTAFLQNSYVHMYREEAGLTEVDINPSTDFAAHISSDPASYDPTCTGGSGDCPNQGFDAINIYYPIMKYRRKLDTRLETLGATVQFALDPINVYVNACRETDANQCANNAFFMYYLDSNGNVTGGEIVFYKPAREGDVWLNDIAREAAASIHEYQHYVTHLITQLESGSSDEFKAGGMLHEGYSDYFALSEISTLSGEIVSTMLDYMYAGASDSARKNGIRDLSQFRPFGGAGYDYEAHYASVSWSSGLWRLRDKLGVDNGDLLALKSQFFMPPDPSLSEAVDALVKADTHLFGGEHIFLIQSTFYDELRFYGGDRVVYLEGPQSVLDFGFSSCMSVHLKYPHEMTGKRIAAFWALMAGWVAVTVYCGRVRRRRGELSCA